MTLKKKTSKTLDLGNRKVSSQNFSKIVTLPKTFTQNCLGEDMRVNMSYDTQDGSLKLTPVCKTKEKGGEKN